MDNSTSLQESEIRDLNDLKSRGFFYGGRWWIRKPQKRAVHVSRCSDQKRILDVRLHGYNTQAESLTQAAKI